MNAPQKIVVGCLFILGMLAIWFGIDYLLTLLVCWAVKELWHPVPFWPVFALIFAIGLLFGGKSASVSASASSSS